MEKVILSNWEDIQKEFNKTNAIDNDFGGYNPFSDFIVFRGQQSEHWPVSSTLERTQLRDSLDDIIFEFDQKSDLFDVHRMQPGITLEKLSLMRHYGVPSPLVDFSFSPYIALFFAFDGLLSDSFSGLDEKALFDKMKAYRENNCALYAVNFHTLNKKEGSSYGGGYDKNLRESEKVFERFYPGSAEGIRAFMPSKYNERISAQQGLFLCLCRKNQNSFQSELETNANKGRVTKYIIPWRLVCVVLYELNKMNINTNTMYPGLEGLGAHVAFKQKLRVLNQLMDDIEYGRLKEIDDAH